MKRGTTIHLRGKDAKAFMDAIQASHEAGGGMLVPGEDPAYKQILLDEVKAWTARAKKAEAAFDTLAEKFAEISDKMNSPAPPPGFCHACNICPISADECEGVTCEVRVSEWAVSKVDGAV